MLVNRVAVERRSPALNLFSLSPGPSPIGRGEGSRASDSDNS